MQAITRAAHTDQICSRRKIRAEEDFGFLLFQLWRLNFLVFVVFLIKMLGCHGFLSKAPQNHHRPSATSPSATSDKEFKKNNRRIYSFSALNRNLDNKV